MTARARGRRASLPAALLVALLGTPLAAGAASVPFTGSLSLLIATLPSIGATGAGVATVNGSGGGAHVGSLALPANAFAAAGATVVITDPAAAPIMGLQLMAQNAAGTFSGSPLGGTMPLVGVAKVCLFYSCNYGPLANLTIPLSVVGAGGAAYSAGVVNLTIQGNPWTTGIVAIGSAVQTGIAHGPASGTSSTAAISGRLRLVSPLLVSTNIGSSPILPTFAVLDLHFVPEAGTLALLGSGLALLAGVGRRLRSERAR